MKRILLASLLCAAGLPAMASAMSSAELLASPARYRVIYADAAEAVYADMTTVRREETGTAFSAVLYAETYKYRPGADDYRRGTLVSNIQRYDAVLRMDPDTRACVLDKKLTDVWDRNGRRIGGAAWCGPLSLADGDDLFIELVRAAEAGEAARL